MNIAILGITLCGLALSAKAAPLTPSAAAAQIDSILAKDWADNKLVGNPAADDSTFVRRLYLDVIGRIPTTRESEDFLADKDANKRAKLIDKLLASEGYAQHFSNYWADVLRVTSSGNQTGPITGAAYMNFVKDSLRTNKPYDQFVQEMIAAQGKAWDNGAIGYYMRDRGMPLDNMATTVRVFLGTRIECAQCHNHPFDKWTQMQFYKMASFTYGVETNDYYGGTMGDVRDLMRDQEKAIYASFAMPAAPKKSKSLNKEAFDKQMREYQAKAAEVKKQREEAGRKHRQEQRNYQEAMLDIRNTMRYTSVSSKERMSKLPHDYKYENAKPNALVSPGTMMGHECVTQPGETQLQAYARWMTGKDNPRFTTVIVNRLWKKAFGLANIEPLDELLDTTTPMNPALQKHLEKLMVDLGYDMKGYLRILLNTSTYQRQVTKKEVAPGEVYHFTGPVLRRMSPEQMWDSFVTLINPDPDMVNVAAREAVEQRILKAKKNADSVDALTAEEALRGVKLSAAVYDKNRERTEARQKQFNEARVAAKDAKEKAEAMKAGPERDAAMAGAKDLREKSDKIRSEINTIQNEGRRVAFAEILLPGQRKLYQKVTGKPYVSTGKTGTGGDQTPVMNDGDMMMAAAGPNAERISIPGYDKQELSKDERKSVSSAQEQTYKEEAQFYGLPEREWKGYFRDRAQQSRSWLRSAELESPAPRGHYLREFGQSDRETIENANNEASVPQALAMMNGQLLPQITGRYSQLMLAMNKAPYPDEKIDAAYMTILSRKPTAKEKETWLQAQDKGLSSMEDLVFALLNTQQFIFIQ